MNLPIACTLSDSERASEAADGDIVLTISGPQATRPSLDQLLDARA